MVGTCAWSAAATSFPSYLAARIINGFFCSVGQGGALMWIKDLFFFHEHPKVINYVEFSIIMSPYLGPLITSFIVSGVSWRWAFWLCTIMSGVGLVLILFLDESLFDRKNPPSSRGSYISRLTGVHQAKDWEHKSLSQWYFYFFGIVGVLVGWFAGHFLHDAVGQYYIKRHGGRLDPEARLIITYPATMICCVSLIILGLAFQYHWHYMVIAVFAATQCVGVMIVTTAINAYLLDSYPEGSGIVGAWVTASRNWAGFMATYIQIDWVTRIGPAKALGIQAAITFASVFFMVFLQVGKLAFTMHPKFSPFSILLQAVLTLILAVTPTLTYQFVSNNTLTHLPRPKTDFNIHNGTLLSPILRTRVPGSPGSEATRSHFTHFFARTLPHWQVEFQNSTVKSNAQDIPIVNVIATRDPPGIPAGNISRLTLVAHYDSKNSPEGFIGAIDSAAPCAIIMHAVRSIDAALSRKWGKSSTQQTAEGIQVIFTDGEEALDPPEMLFGARALAAEWENTPYPPSSRYSSRIKAISLFVLLDLLGSSEPAIASYFNTTHDVYRRAAMLEKRLRGLNQFKSGGVRPWLIDADRDEIGMNRFPIYDDQVPFEERGVDVLHWIDANPDTGEFPKVWHTLDDTGENLDLDVMEDWGVLLVAFIVEWLELEGYMP
ncbi:glutaminyl cyclase [Aspergillus bombycis]|uniref:Peptide hydrolase n=1 Tax=Aspergillus bombycis TaxID=109264 RepID=A0A1F8A974_9EURO|nr:glutaminyl cyclase [Aspergillus bombycis]OGM48241.1 glutaminyl cyclase [Aspergillus bombycis]